MRFGSDSDIKKLLTALTVLITKLRKCRKKFGGTIYLSEEENKQFEDIKATEIAIWKNIYPVRKLGRRATEIPI